MIGVPHAGRTYPEEDSVRCLVPVFMLAQLEDRLVDRLVEPMALLDGTIVIATHARAWLDLNRSSREIDPAMVEGLLPRDLNISPRVRAGLGLLPRRLANGRQIWRTPLPIETLERRIADHHFPYHEALRRGLMRARARFGTAILLDCHSMPPLRREAGMPPVDIVIGDRNASSADPRLSELLVAIARDHGFNAVRNAPYAGGYTTEHHGRPQAAIHALQLEIDRGLYLDALFDGPGPGFAATQALLRAMVLALGAEAGQISARFAAE